MFLKKYILFTWQLFCASTMCYGQTCTIIAYDTDGRGDTLTIGLSSHASLGQDLILGETNLYGLPSNRPIDLRIMQRSIDAQDCIASRLDTLVYADNFDSKINFRNVNQLWSHEQTDFQISVKSDSAAVQSLVMVCNVPANQFLESITWLKDSCLGLSYTTAISSQGTNSLFFSEEPIYAMKIRLRTSASETNALPDKSEVFAYPNPCTAGSDVHVFDVNYSYESAELVQLDGKILRLATERMHSDLLQLSIPSTAKNGYGRLRLISGTGQVFSIPLIITD